MRNRAAPDEFSFALTFQPITVLARSTPLAMLPRLVCAIAPTRRGARGSAPFGPLRGGLTVAVRGDRREVSGRGTSFRLRRVRFGLRPASNREQARRKEKTRQGVKLDGLPISFADYRSHGSARSR